MSRQQRSIRSRPGWTRVSAPGDKCGAAWVHDASGWNVRHCWHPTANWPYYLVDPARPTRTVVSFNGHGFIGLEVAFTVIERIVAGTLTVTTRKCVRGIARVLVDAGGEPVSRDR